MRGIAEDLRARWLPLRDGKGPWRLFGISLGGMVAMQWCGDHPRDFEGVVLGNTSAGDVGMPWERMKPGALGMVLRALLPLDPRSRERSILRVVTSMVPDVERLAEEWAGYHREAPLPRATVARQIAAAVRFRAPARLELPVLVLAGGADALTSPACPRRLAQRYGAPFEEHPRAGHDLALDDPDWVAERLRKWALARAAA